MSPLLLLLLVTSHLSLKGKAVHPSAGLSPLHVKITMLSESLLTRPSQTQEWPAINLKTESALSTQVFPTALRPFRLCCPS